ncbi:TetR/AcrR family transcriptional regulator [Blastococcus sp. SYSU D00820]
MHDVQTDAPGGLREAKKAETRRRLTTAARELVLAAGLDGVTVERICTEAGVSLRTFFNYFESKESAVLGEEPPMGTPESRAAFVAGGPSGDLLADLLDLLDPSVQLAAEGREGLRTVMALAEREPRLLARHLARVVAHERELADLIAARRGLPGADDGARAVAATALALARTAGGIWFEAGDDTPFAVHLHRLRDAAVALLAPPPPSASDAPASRPPTGAA